MRVSLLVNPLRPWPSLVDVARDAEAAGWHAIRIDDARSGRECFVIAAALAASLGRIRLDLVVDDGRLRHPAVVAKQASTIDRLSGGRLLLGLAPGPEPDGRSRLAEGFQVIRELSSRPRTTMNGEFYRLQDAPLDPKPWQQPLPLMLVGGDSAAAARLADHWSVLGEPAAVGAQLAPLREACRRAGRDPKTITLSAPYPADGVDEWVVPEALVTGEGRPRQEVLARLADEARAVGDRLID